MENAIKFGTDGWRAIIADEYTFSNVRACAQGVADYLKGTGLAEWGLLIGYDTRFMSEDFAAASAGVIAGNGIKTYLCTRTAPTPVISYGVLERKAAGAVIITASHNPGIWNGFKYKNEYGSSASDEITAHIESAANRAVSGKISSISLEEARGKGLLGDFEPAPPYLRQIERLVDLESIRKAKLKVVIDPMYGAGSGYLAKLLEGGTIKVNQINSERNPIFPGMERPEPIAVNLKKLSRAVKEQGAQVGLATDGDADRMGIIDENGNFLTQLQVFALLCLYLLEVRGERGAIVKTITTTSMIFRLGELFNVPVFEEQVGFKNVAPVMMQNNALIGGEESGGYGFRGHVAERDGILANLYFLDFMVKTGKTPSQLLDYLYGKVGPHYYEREDITYPAQERSAIVGRFENPPDKIEGIAVRRIDKTDGYRFILEDNSWLLVRFSGTEPVLRIYAEASSLARAKKMVQWGRGMAGV